MADDIDSLLDEVEDKYMKKNTRQPVKPAVKQNTVNHTTSQQKTKRLVLYHFKSCLWLFSVTQDLKSHTLVIKFDQSLNFDYSPINQELNISFC